MYFYFCGPYLFLRSHRALQHVEIVGLYAGNHMRRQRTVGAEAQAQASETHQLQIELVAGASSSTALNLPIAFFMTFGSVAVRISCMTTRNGQ